MTSLAERQSALVAALFGRLSPYAAPIFAEFTDVETQSGKPHRGWLAYKANGDALAERSLQASCPVVAQLLGEESFKTLARAFWHAHPPERGDLAQWGGELARFVLATGQLAEEPYLPDVARLEWSLHRCASCADAAVEHASFALLMALNPQDIHLVLAPGCAILHSAWPVVSIVNAHLHGRPTLADAGQKLRDQVGETAVIWREQFQPCCREALPGEAAFLAALLEGPAASGNLGSALELAPALDFTIWLPVAVQSGLLLAARPVAPPG